MYNFFCATPSVGVDRHHQPPQTKPDRLPKRLSALLPKHDIIPYDLAMKYGGQLEFVKSGMRCDIYRNKQVTIRAVAIRRLTHQYARDFSFLLAATGKALPTGYFYHGDYTEARVQDVESLKKGIAHENIVKIKDLVYSPDYLFVIEDRLLGPSLPDHLTTMESNDQGINEVDACQLFKGMLSAVGYLHEHGIIHRTLSSHKWVFEKAPAYPTAASIELGKIMLVDFTHAAQLRSDKPWYTENEAGPHTMLVGNQYYHSPEVFDLRCWNFASDVWSLGVIFYEVLFSGSMPFFARKVKDLPKAITEKDIELDDNEISPALVKVIHAMLQKDSALRPTIKQLQEDFEWFKDVQKAQEGWIRKDSPAGSLRTPPVDRHERCEKILLDQPQSSASNMMMSIVRPTQSKQSSVTKMSIAHSLHQSRIHTEPGHQKTDIAPMFVSSVQVKKRVSVPAQDYAHQHKDDAFVFPEESKPMTDIDAPGGSASVKVNEINWFTKVKQSFLPPKSKVLSDRV